jgi:hypothetical protein
MRTIFGAAVLSLALLGSQQQEPRITGVTPEKLVTSQKPQTLTVTGEGFGSGLTLFLTTPGGAVKQFAGSDLAAQRATSFQVSVALAEAGRYSLEVVNEKGPRSTAFTLEVRAPKTQPWIDEVMPAEFSRSRDAQLATIAGRNFAPGLRVSVSDPTGETTTADVVRVEAQSVVIRVLFEQAGPHEVMLTNPSGEKSNAVSISVN